MKNRILISALAAGLVGFGAAHAQPPASGDNNNDNDHAKGEQMFERLDTNGDGSLSPDELKQMRQEMAKMRFETSDTNGDGSIDHDEFTAQAQKRADAMFKRMDANDDGKLSAEEAKRTRHGMHGGHGKPHHDNKDGDATKSKGMKDHDKGDHGKRWFDRMDSDSNGQISHDEWDTAMQKMHERHQAHAKHDSAS